MLEGVPEKVRAVEQDIAALHTLRRARIPSHKPSRSFKTAAVSA